MKEYNFYNNTIPEYLQRYPEASKAFLEFFFDGFGDNFIEFRLLAEGRAQIQRFYSSVNNVEWDFIRRKNTEGYGAYFGVCPRREKEGNKAAVSAVPTLWVDLDAKDFCGGKEEALAQFEKLPCPSVIIDSGYGYHGYWFLTKPYPTGGAEDIQQIESYLRGISEILNGDSVYDVSRILRLPGTLNMKNPGKPLLCQIIYWEPHKCFNLSDFEAYRVDTYSISNQKDISFSEQAPEVSLTQLLVSDRIKKLIREGWQSDSNYPSRSEADQAVITALLEVSCSHDVIRAVFANPDWKIGDKYRGKGDRYGNQYLVHSIAKAKTFLEQKVPFWVTSSSIDERRTRVVQTRKSKSLAPFEKKERVARLIINDLQEKSFLIDAGDNYYWFWDDEKKVLELDSDEFKALIEEWYGINESETEWNYLKAALRTATVLEGKKCKVYRFAHYENEKLYVDRFDGQVYQLNGKKIELISNGEDGVFFYSDPEWEPYQYLGAGQKSGYLFSLLIEPINFSRNAGLSPTEQQVLWQLWLYSIFFESLLPTKPILLFLGEKGSGKTSTLRWILKWLFGSKADVHSLTKDKEDAFIATVTSSYLACFDNVDARISWLNDRLAALATGAKIPFRKLYTTNQRVEYYPRVFVALTSRTPQFKRDDIVDRLLLFQVDRIESFKSERYLLEERIKLRNELWSEMLEDLNQIVKALQEDKENLSTSHRLADWVELAWKIAKIQGGEKYFLDIVRKLEADKNIFLLEDDPLYLGLELWLDGPANEGRELEIQGLFSELKQVCESNNVKWNYESPRSLAQRIAWVTNSLKDFFEVQVTRKRFGKSLKNFYSFRRKN